MIELTATAAFDRRAHPVDAFGCGEESLDRWLRAYAGQTQRRDPARTFVTADPDGNVIGHYTLVAAQIEHEQATAGVRRGLSRRFPIPVALTARLAVASSHQGIGLGRSLLLDALQRILKASEEIAVRAVTVDALDGRAASFYHHFGFEPTELAPTPSWSPSTLCEMPSAAQQVEMAVLTRCHPAPDTRPRAQRRIVAPLFALCGSRCCWWAASQAAPGVRAF